MTELYLNAYPAILDKSASIKVVFENPYFNKSSTYTYNISLPLSECEENQLIFKHINRADVAKRTQTLKAVLISDNIVLINGTAVVTEITETKVQVQLLSGNSELNFFTSGDKLYINEMNLGYSVYPPEDFVPGHETDVYFAEYPKTSCVWFPIYNESADEIYNRLAANYIISGDKWIESYHHYDAVYYKWCVQPYLCTIIKKIIDQIGYTLVENQIEETIFKNLFICNATVTPNFADTLPHWTVNEFFTELERFLGLVVVVDDGTRTIRIMFSPNFYESDNCVYIDKVIDEFNAKIDKEETTDVTNGNVGYSFSSSEANKYKRIDTEIMKKAKMNNYISYNELYEEYNEMNQYDRDSCIFVAEGKHYIDFTEDGVNHKLKEVNQYRDLMNSPEKLDLDIELKFVPVAMCRQEVEVYAPGTIFDENLLWKGVTAIPSMDGGVFSPRTNADHVVIQQEIEGNGIEEKYTPDTIQLAFNDGKHRAISGPEDKSHLYPVPFTDCSEDISGYGVNFPSWSLKLVTSTDVKSVGSEIYSKMKKVNTTVEETKKFISDKIYDPKLMFIIHNKKYVCKMIEIEANISGIVPLQQATMYELLE